MRTSLRWAVLLIALGACAPGRPGELEAAAVLPGDLTGCHQLHQTSGTYFASRLVRLNPDTVPRSIRWFVRDSTSPAWTITRLDAEGRPMRGRSGAVLFWQRDSDSDSIRIMMHTGLSGTELMLGPPVSTDTLRGRAIEFWDVGPPFSSPARPVSFVRVSCLGEPGPT